MLYRCSLKDNGKINACLLLKNDTTTSAKGLALIEEK